MPSAFKPTANARKVAIARAGTAGRASALGFLANDESFGEWQIGETLDFYGDLCKYNDKVEPLINRLSLGEVVPSKDRQVLRAAIGAVQAELRKLTKNDKASVVANTEFGPISLDENENGEPVTQYLLTRTA